jgi:hypothetical protein
MWINSKIVAKCKDSRGQGFKESSVTTLDTGHKIHDEK